MRRVIQPDEDACLLLSEFEQRCSEGVDIDVDALTRPWSDQGPSSDAKLMLFEDAPVRSPMMIPQEHAIAGCGEILGTGEQGAATSRCCEGRCAGGWRGAEDSVQEEGPERLHTTKRSIGGPFGRVSRSSSSIIAPLRASSPSSSSNTPTVPLIASFPRATASRYLPYHSKIRSSPPATAVPGPSHGMVATS